MFPAASPKVRADTVHCSVASHGKSILEMEIGMGTLYSAYTFLWGGLETELFLGTMGHRVPCVWATGAGEKLECIHTVWVDASGYQGSLSGK